MEDTAAGKEPEAKKLLEMVEDQRRMGVEADAVLRLGMMLMGAGTGGYRVMRAMKRAARSLGFDDLDVIVSVNTITCTFHRGERFRTVVANQHNPAVDASRIEAIEHFTHSIDRPMTAEELNAYLDRIEENVRKRWSWWILALAAGLACAGFALLNHYSATEAAVVAVSAASGQTLRFILGHRHLNQLGTVAMAGLAACLSYYGISVALSAMGVVDPGSLSAGYVAAALFLIPGFPLFSAILDLSRFDITAGLSRLTYACLVIATATMSVGTVSWITGLNPLPPGPGEADVAWFITAALGTAMGIGGFAFLFNSSRRMVTIAVLIGTVANVLRLGLLALGLPQQFSVFVGALAVGLLGAAMAKPARLPRITMTVPAAVIMIPGTAMYRTVYYLNTGDMDVAISNAVTAVLSVIAIGAGLVVARMLTDRDWAFGRLIDFDHRPGAAGVAAAGRGGLHLPFPGRRAPPGMGRLVVHRALPRPPTASGLRPGINPFEENTMSSYLLGPPTVGSEILEAEPVPLVVARFPDHPFAEMSAAFDSTFAALFPALAARQITPVGPAVAVYHSIPGDTLTFEVGIPVDGPLTGEVHTEGGVILCNSTLPAGPVARTSYFGGYGGLGEAWSRFITSLDDVRQAMPYWEVYVTEPTPDADPATLRTDLYTAVTPER